MRHTLTGFVGGLALCVGLAACNDSGQSERVRLLDDEDGDGLLEEDGGGLIIPEPGECPVMQWREIHTVTTDELGNVISETFTVCTQCFEADGTPIGEEVCSEEPPVPPDMMCTEYDSGDPTLVCYSCVMPDGTLVVDECYPLPVECTSDADCPAGQVCYLAIRPDDPAGGGDPSEPGMETPPEPAPGDVGFCGYPDPCVAVPSLPSDPTGESCFVCTDPVTGDDWGSWCDFHRCGDDGSCVNPYEACDAASGYCVFIDPCQPVASLPSDPTGESCWSCTDPVTGEDWGSWCDVHRCAADGSCVNSYEACDAATGYCVYVDPCTPSTGADGITCWSCIDETGAVFAEWCDPPPCGPDSPCPEGTVCDEASGYCFGADGTEPMPMR